MTLNYPNQLRWQMSDGGKGSAQRPTDQKAYANNFDRIFGKKKEVKIDHKNTSKTPQKGLKNDLKMA